MAIMVAMSFMTALLVTGAAIDYSRSVTQQSNLQQATDATALAVAHTYLKNQSSQSIVNKFATDYIAGLKNGATVVVDTLPSNYQSVCMTSSLSVPTSFMKMANINAMNVSARACSQIPSTGATTYEVALALDNSGSMGNAGSDGSTKISSLIAAAKQLVTTLIPSSTNPTANISLVPFNAAVNANVNLSNSSTTPAFMDTTGVSSIHWQNFQRPTGSTFQPKTKFDMFNALAGTVTWAGCVEERPYPYITTDTAASKSTGDTMFVPYFAPDEPGFVNGKYYSGYACYQGQPFSNTCSNRYYNSYLSDYSYQYQATGNCNQYNQQADLSSSNIFPNSTMSMVCKYSNATVSNASSDAGYTVGPNFQCTAQQLTPLTNSASTLNTALGSMTAGGSTNLASGFMWAWRTISPTVNAFPTSNSASTVGYHNPQSYSTSGNTKVIILLTDGQNDYAINNNDSYFQSLYGAFGYYANDRLSKYVTSSSGWSYGKCSSYSSTADIARCKLDNVTLEACTNAKAQNITVYTIGVSVPGGDQIDARGISLLQTCATNTGDYFQVSDLSSLNSAFQQIASGVNNLRLSQ